MRANSCSSRPPCVTITNNNHNHNHKSESQARRFSASGATELRTEKSGRKKEFFCASCYFCVPCGKFISCLIFIIILFLAKLMCIIVSKLALTIIIYILYGTWVL